MSVEGDFQCQFNDGSWRDVHWDNGVPYVQLDPTRDRIRGRQMFSEAYKFALEAWDGLSCLSVAPKDRDAITEAFKNQRRK